MSTTSGVDEVWMEGAATAKEVLPLLREQAGLYGRLEGLASRQRSLVSGEDVGPLLAVLAERQKLSEHLARLEVRLAPVRRDWAAHRARLTPADGEEADRQLREVRERLARIIEGDEQDARVLAGRRRAVAVSLQSTHATGRALAAYRPAGERAGRLDCMHDGA